MDIEQQLRVALAPARPGPRVRAAVMARLAADPASRVPQRWVLVGLALALGAAAAMFANRWWDPPAQATLAHAAPDAVQSQPAGPVGDAAVAPPVELVSAEPANAPEPTNPKARQFTVQVMPLQSEVADPARKAAIESVYALLVNGLRSVSAARILDTPAAGDAAPATPDYRLTLTGTANPAIQGNGYVVRLKSTWFRDGGKEGGSLHGSIAADA
jgi:hypothetical protein